MPLLIIVILLSNQPSKIPYQQQLATYKETDAQYNSADLKNAYLSFAKIIRNWNTNEETDNAKQNSDNNPQNRMFELTFLLVVINALYVIVGIFQWRAIKYQVRMSNRAQLAVSPAGEPVKDLLNAPDPHMQVDLGNVGHTTAYDCRYETWIELLPFPFTEFSTLADHVVSQEPCVLHANHKPITINIPMRGGLTHFEKEDVIHYRRHICVRVRATYRDIFGWRRRWISAAFYIEPSGFAFLPKYNDAN
jgi:hypothetical protein